LRVLPLERAGGINFGAEVVDHWAATRDGSLFFGAIKLEKNGAFAIRISRTFRELLTEGGEDEFSCLGRYRRHLYGCRGRRQDRTPPYRQGGDHPGAGLHRSFRIA
jgi:hypothetical protein